MTEPTVIETDATQPGVPGQGQGKDDVTIPKAEFDRLNRELTEIRQSERDWASRAMRGGQQTTEQPLVQDNDDFDGSEFLDPELLDGNADDTPEKLVEEIAAKGVGALKSRGYVTAAQVQRLAIEAATKVSRELIGRAEQRVGLDARILTEFPDLKKQDSELFLETSKLFKAAVEMDKNALKTPSAMYLAARAASEAIKGRAASQRRTRDDEEPEPEAERRLRAASQDSRPSGRREIDDTEDMMGPEAKILMKGFGITEAEYKASQKELAGVGRGRKR